MKQTKENKHRAALKRRRLRRARLKKVGITAAMLPLVLSKGAPVIYVAARYRRDGEASGIEQVIEIDESELEGVVFPEVTLAEEVLEDADLTAPDEALAEIYVVVPELEPEPEPFILEPDFAFEAPNFLAVPLSGVAVRTEQELRTAITDAATAPTTIIIAASFDLAGGVDIPNGADITLVSDTDATEQNPRVIGISGSRRHFYVQSGGNLTLGETGGENSHITLSHATSSIGGGLAVFNGGIFTMHGGVISGIRNDGAVGVMGTFIMNGGAISGNTRSAGALASSVLLGGTFTISGAVTIDGEINGLADSLFTITDTGILTVPASESLTIFSNITLTNNGTIDNLGTLNNNGTINSQYGTWKGNAPTGSGIFNASRLVNLATLNDGNDGDGWSFADGVLTVNNGADIIVTSNGAQTDRRVVTNGTATVTIRDLVIATPNAPITLTVNTTLNLNIEGVNRLTATGGAMSGILVPIGQTLNIIGSGELTSRGQGGGAGIGGQGAAGVRNAGTITISDNVTVRAYGSGGGGSGIGGAGNHASNAGHGGTVTIGGHAVVYAHGLDRGAGIGGGGTSAVIGGSGATLVIEENARVVVTSSAEAAGIGGGGASLGTPGASGNITIRDNATINVTVAGISESIGRGRNWANNLGTLGTVYIADTATVTVNRPAAIPLVEWTNETPSLSYSTMTFGDANRSLSVNAPTRHEALANSHTIQWYRNTTNSNTDGTRVEDMTGLNPNMPSDIPVGTHYFYALVVVDGATGFDVRTNTAQVTVNPATGAAVNPPTQESRTATSITVEADFDGANPGNQTIEFAKNTTNEAPSSGWQTSNIFGGLDEDSTYYFFARAAQNATHQAGQVSNGTQMRTARAEINIREQPSGATVTFGSISGQLSVSADRTPGGTLTYQWQRQRQTGGWENIADATYRQFDIPTDLNAGQHTFRVLINTANGDAVESNSAEVTVNQRVITVTPDSGQFKYEGQDEPTLTFSIEGYLPDQSPAFTGALGREATSTPGLYNITLGNLALEDNEAFLADNHRLVLPDTPVTFEIREKRIEITKDFDTPRPVLLSDLQAVTDNPQELQDKLLDLLDWDPSAASAIKVNDVPLDVTDYSVRLTLVELVDAPGQFEVNVTFVGNDSNFKHTVTLRNFLALDIQVSAAPILVHETELSDEAAWLAEFMTVQVNDGSEVNVIRPESIVIGRGNTVHVSIVHDDFQTQIELPEFLVVALHDTAKISNDRQHKVIVNQEGLAFEVGQVTAADLKEQLSLLQLDLSAEFGFRALTGADKLNYFEFNQEDLDKLLESDKAGEFKVRFDFGHQSNSREGAGELTVRLTARAIILSAPTLDRVTATSIKIVSSEVQNLPAGGAIEYAIRPLDSEAAFTDWQTLLIFENLAPNTAYEIVARVLGTEIMSQPLLVNTKAVADTGAPSEDNAYPLPPVESDSDEDENITINADSDLNSDINDVSDYEDSCLLPRTGASLSLAGLIGMAKIGIAYALRRKKKPKQ